MALELASRLSGARASEPATASGDSVAVSLMDDILTHQRAVEAGIAAMEAATSRLTQLVDDSVVTFEPDALEKLSHQIVAETQRGAEAAKAAKAQLDEMKAEGEAVAATSPDEPGLAGFRAQYFRLARLFLAAVKEHQRIKERARVVETETLVRRGKLMYGDEKSEDEIRAAVAADPEGFVRKAVLLGHDGSGGSADYDTQLSTAEATARAKDILSITRSIAEVHSLFLELSMLVQHQGETINAVEVQVEAAGKHVTRGNQQLAAAARKRRRWRKFWCCMAILGAVLVALLIAALSVFLTGAYKSFVPH